VHALAALDGELAGIGPGQALFEEASRLRAKWRLGRGDAAAATEARAIVETLLMRRPNPANELLRARVALAAGDDLAASGRLSRIAELPRATARAQALRESALGLATQLPEKLAADLRARLAPPAPRGLQPCG
jgi:hypothetical protein